MNNYLPHKSMHVMATQTGEINKFDPSLHNAVFKCYAVSAMI